MVPIEALLVQYLTKLTPCYSVKQTGFSVSLDKVDADMPLAQDCQIPLIDPTMDTIMALVCVALTSG